jgi:hypothetical protein
MAGTALPMMRISHVKTDNWIFAGIRTIPSLATRWKNKGVDTEEMS